MATYFIFPEKDATIYGHPLKTSLNTGRDEILEIVKENYGGTYYNSRALIQFTTNDIQTAVDQIGTSSFTASLQLFSTEHEELAFNQTLIAHVVSESWENGTGRASNSPQTVDGVSWLYTVSASAWENSGSTFLTGSEYETSQSFSAATDLDTNIDITSQVLLWYSGSIDNNGFVVKRIDPQESGNTHYGALKYFSKDTHTVYPPRIKFEWDDSVYSTGSLSVINTGSFAIQLKDTPSEVLRGNTQRFRMYARPKYPARTFQTSSLVSVNYALPSSSYYSVRDYKTGDILVNYSNNSKLSCDSSGMYFDLDTTGYQPERYYKIIFKITNSEGDKIIDDDFVFKIVR
jgi:hypothetical protein